MNTIDFGSLANLSLAQQQVNRNIDRDISALEEAVSNLQKRVERLEEVNEQKAKETTKESRGPA